MGISIETELPRTATAARQARRLLDEMLGGRIEATQLDRSKLLVSELVNNAVLHGQGTITLRMDVDEDRLRAEVIDEGPGFERVVRDNALDHLGGWGLAVVEAESSRWGVHESTTRVWFEIEHPGPRIGEDKNPNATDATDQQPAIAASSPELARPSVMLSKRPPAEVGRTGLLDRYRSTGDRQLRDHRRRPLLARAGDPATAGLKASL